MTKLEQHRGLRPNPHTLGVRPLEEGEGTKTYRVRASLKTLERFQNMSSDERGQFLERVLSDVPLEGFEQSTLKASWVRFNSERLRTLRQVSSKAPFDAVAILREGRDRM